MAKAEPEGSHDSNEDQIDGKQKHAQVFGDVHDLLFSVCCLYVHAIARGKYVTTLPARDIFDLRRLPRVQIHLFIVRKQLRTPLL